MLVFLSNDAARPSLGVRLRGEGVEPPSTMEASIDDGTVETGAVGDGLAIVNRLTPSSYPAQLQKVRPYFVQFQGQPNPSGRMVRLIAWAETTGSAPSTQAPALLFDIPVTIPNVPAAGAFAEFSIPSPPTIASGDFYVGYIAPS